MPSTQEEEEEHEALAIDEKGFDPKAFKLLIKVGYDPKESSALGNFLLKLPVLKAKAQTVIFTQVQFDDEDDKESVASSNYISNGAEEDITRTYHITLIEDGEVEEEDTEDAPAELEEGIKATIDELKEVNLGDIENPQPIYISASLTQEEEGTYIALLHEFKCVVLQGNARIRPKDATTSHEALSFMDGSSGYNQICMALADEELTAFRTPKGLYCYKVMPFGLKNADTTYQRAMQRIFNDMLTRISNATLMTWC
ncbi:hypothetical protein Sango_3114600 [Sesamum angolense]|uniref:Reverse transcriptase domain-containing protein n=1 Tax=Sesamum angolense TaxID=2727404 RepID=A0AAE1T8F1_9LAMI|nr:hypothetical protein Sango_3114600 [Sesamum angolense]